MSWFAVASELQVDWRNATGPGFAQILAQRLPFYGNLIEQNNFVLNETNSSQNVQQNVPQNVPQNVTQNVPQNVTQNVPQNVTQTVPPNLAQNSTLNGTQSPP